jgi:hypothetical protein
LKVYLNGRLHGLPPKIGGSEHLYASSTVT